MRCKTKNGLNLNLLTDTFRSALILAYIEGYRMWTYKEGQKKSDHKGLTITALKKLKFAKHK